MKGGEKSLNKELKRCPFCGGGAKLVKTMGGFYKIQCEECAVQTRSLTHLEAMALWNKREYQKIPKSDLTMLFGTRLERLRTKNQLSQKQLAEQVGTLGSILNAVESGKAQADYDMIVRLARTLHVTTDYLLGNRRDYETEQVQSKKI